MASEYLEFDLICHNLLLHFQEDSKKYLELQFQSLLSFALRKISVF